jgi:hypothetical protein
MSHATDSPPPPQSLADALPKRPVAVTPPLTVAPLGSLGMVALLLTFLGGLAWWLGPDLVRDWRIGSDAIPAADVRLENPRCASRLAVLNLCDVTLADERTPGEKRRLWYAFIGTGAAEDLAVLQPLRSASDPRLVATTLGLARRTQRALTLALGLALIGACIAAVVRMIQQSLVNFRAFRRLSGQRLTPVVVDIERNNLVPPRRRLWVYLYDDVGKRERAFIELPSKDRPLFTDSSEKRALALRGERGGMPLLIDARLKCLDLTGPEKESFYAACRAAFGLPGGSASP